MSKRRRAKATRSAKRRYGILIVSIALAIILVAVGISALQGPDTPSGSAPSLSEIPRISVEEVKAKLDAGSNIAIVDARTRVEYEQSHIAGAISVPLGEIGQRYSDLQRYDEIVTYCT
ncbi:MAG: rhodanese-like domain-containing protein [Dehalococcoidia bacterium]